MTTHKPTPDEPTKQEMVDILTQEGDPEAAALFAALTDDEFAASLARAQKMADEFGKDPLLRLELEIALDEAGE